MPRKKNWKQIVKDQNVPGHFHKRFAGHVDDWIKTEDLELPENTAELEENASGSHYPGSAWQLESQAQYLSTWQR